MELKNFEEFISENVNQNSDLIFFCKHSDFCTYCPLFHGGSSRTCHDHEGIFVSKDTRIENGNELIWVCINGDWSWQKKDIEPSKFDNSKTSKRRIIDGKKCRFYKGHWVDIDNKDVIVKDYTNDVFGE